MMILTSLCTHMLWPESLYLSKYLSYQGLCKRAFLLRFSWWNWKTSNMFLSVKLLIWLIKWEMFNMSYVSSENPDQPPPHPCILIRTISVYWYIISVLKVYAKFGTFLPKWPRQTVQTKVKLLLLQEEFDHGLHCLPFYQVFLLNKCIKIQAIELWWKGFEILGNLPYPNNYTSKQGWDPDQTVQRFQLFCASAVHLW